MPNCLYCGKKLLRKYHWTRGATDAEAKAKIPKEATRIQKIKPKFDGHIEWRYWLGEWGAYRDNYFCGLRCGYNYGVSKAKE